MFNFMCGVIVGMVGLIILVSILAYIHSYGKKRMGEEIQQAQLKGYHEAIRDMKKNIMKNIKD